MVKLFVGNLPEGVGKSKALGTHHQGHSKWGKGSGLNFQRDNKGNGEKKRKKS